MEKLFMKKLLFLLFVCPCAWSGDWWTDSKLTNGLMISANALMIADWAQTRWIADNPRMCDGGTCTGYWEAGFAANFIGRSPDRRDVDRYFAASVILTNLTGYLLPKKYKNLFYISSATYSASHAYGNHQIGIEFKF